MRNGRPPARQRRALLRLITALSTLAILVGCTPATGFEPTARPQAPVVDVLAYVLGDPSRWPRFGTQFQAQIVDASTRSVCWVKYGRPDMFECWRWDDQWLYHAVDHAIDGAIGESYTFSDGRWLPRTFEGEWSLDVTDNHIRWFDHACAATEHGERAGMPVTGLFPYRLRAWVEPARGAGALGIRDVLVLEYAPHAPNQGATDVERFYFAKGDGWYRWESTRGAATFDSVGGPRIVSHGAACLHQ
jgi:hypothetical protein